MTPEKDIAEMALKDRQIESLVQQNDELRREVENLREQIALMQRRMYGPRSERYHPNQLLLDDVLKKTQSDSAPAEEPKVPVKAGERRKARPHGRLMVPEHLERVDEILDLPEEKKKDPRTGEALVKIQDEISEKLAIRPGVWYVRRFIRPIYGHPDKTGESAGIYAQPMPDSPVAKCKADNSVLALVAVRKYVDHLPLYRQRDMFSREGIEIADSTLNAWAIEPILACEPLYQAFKMDVLSRATIFVDDSPVDLLVPGLGRTKQARVWAYVGGCGPPHRFYDFTPDRRKERPGNILAKYEGYMHADAYSGFDELFREHPKIIEVGCWAHARRYFDEARISAVKASTEILERIRALYEIESRIREENPERRLAARQAESVPLLDAIYERFATMNKEREILPGSRLGKAIGYATNQRAALYRYTTDGRLEIDNNTAENAIRALALGRKNWLFAGSERGGKACAIALTFLQSARAVGANPYDYLLDIYNRIMSHPVTRLHELLPAAWLKNRSAKP